MSSAHNQINISVMFQSDINGVYVYKVSTYLNEMKSSMTHHCSIHYLFFNRELLVVDGWQIELHMYKP